MYYPLPQACVNRNSALTSSGPEVPVLLQCPKNVSQKTGYKETVVAKWGK